MTQTAGQRPEQDPQSWASGSDGGRDEERYRPNDTQPVPSYVPAYSSPANPPTAQYPGTEQRGFDPFAPPAPPPGGTGQDGGDGPERPRRRPGWVGAAAIAGASALVASLLTVGLVEARDDDASNASASTGTRQADEPQVRAPVTSGDATDPDWGAVAKAVEPSVVSVQVRAQGGSGEGSGVVLDGDGRVVTNNHVVAGAGDSGQIRVVLSDGRSYAARIVGTDPSTDLAVIQMQDAPEGLTPATIGNSDQVAVGDPVMAIGNPLGLSDTVTTGIVSALNRPVTTEAESDGENPFGGGQSAGEQVVTNAIQTDAAVNPGNSGGALVDAQGRVIGITSSIASLGVAGGQAGSIGLGFAIPSNEAKAVADQLAGGGEVQHSFLGVNLTEDLVEVDGAERDAAVLSSVTDGAAADKAGLQDGDAVIAVNGEPVNSATSLVAQIRERRPGTEVELTIARDGKSQKVTVTLGTRPN